MYANSILKTLLALGLMATASAELTLKPRAVRKANEFVSPDCAQGTASYEHASNFNTDVTMDDTSHSVYFASGPWYYYSQKLENGLCSGDVLGSWNNDNDHPCVNLDNRPGDSRRIACVRWNNQHP